jgi:hypothetical protein
VEAEQGNMFISYVSTLFVLSEVRVEMVVEIFSLHKQKRGGKEAKDL